MNVTLVEQWDTVIDPDGSVLYGGDLTIHISAAASLDWLEQRNGEIVSLLGNHDKTIVQHHDSVQFVESALSS